MPVIRKGDTVKVIAGKEKGKSGNVLEVLREAGRVRIEKLMTVKRHVRKGRSQSNPRVFSRRYAVTNTSAVPAVAVHSAILTLLT